MSEHLGIGLLALHVLAADDGTEPGCPTVAHVLAHQGFEIGAARRRGDSHAHAVVAALAHQFQNAPAQRDARPATSSAYRAFFFACSARASASRSPARAGRVGPAAHVVHQALASAGHLQELAVASIVPAPRQAEGLEGEVERDPMPVALGLGNGAIDVPQQGIELGHCQHSCARLARISKAGSVLPSSTSRKAPPPVEM